MAVDGKVVSTLGSKVDPQRSTISVDGKPIALSIPKVYIMLNKPAGYVSTRSDPWGRRTVMDLVKPMPGLHPVGRLDYDVEGMLLLTNDGEFTFGLTHPKHEIEKVYRVKVQGRPKRQAMARLRQGVQLKEGTTAPARVRMIGSREENATLQLTIHEGRKRQVKRMLRAVGHQVLELRRVGICPLKLGTLPAGKWRSLSKLEVEALKRLIRPV